MYLSLPLLLGSVRGPNGSGGRDKWGQRTSCPLKSHCASAFKGDVGFFPLRRAWVYFSCSANIHWASGMTVGTRDGVLNKTKPCPEELMLAGRPTTDQELVLAHQGAVRTWARASQQESTHGGWGRCCAAVQGEAISRTGPVRARGRRRAGKAGLATPPSFFTPFSQRPRCPGRHGHAQLERHRAWGGQAVSLREF